MTGARERLLCSPFERVLLWKMHRYCFIFEKRSIFSTFALYLDWIKFDWIPINIWTTLWRDCKDRIFAKKSNIQGILMDQWFLISSNERIRSNYTDIYHSRNTYTYSRKSGSHTTLDPLWVNSAFVNLMVYFDRVVFLRQVINDWRYFKKQTDNIEHITSFSTAWNSLIVYIHASTLLHP